MRTLKYSAFTLINLIVVLGIIAILLALLTVAINPARQFAQARNQQRRSDVKAIGDAIYQHSQSTSAFSLFPASITTRAQEVCNGKSGVDCTGKLDLRTMLVPQFIADIPNDPRYGTDAAAKYRVVKNEDNCLTVFSEKAELNDLIFYGCLPNLSYYFTRFSYIELTVTPTLQLSDTFTWEAWIKRDPEGLNNWQRLYASTVTVPTAWIVHLDNLNRLVFTENSVADYSATTALTDTENWYHLAIVKSGNGSGNLRFFINGVQDGVVSVGGVSIPQNVAQIGHGSGGFRGAIDELRLSNIARYTANFTPETELAADSDTAALWHFEDNAEDASGNGNHGTLMGNPPPERALGVY